MDFLCDKTQIKLNFGDKLTNSILPPTLLCSLTGGAFGFQQLFLCFLMPYSSLTITVPMLRNMQHTKLLKFSVPLCSNQGCQWMQIRMERNNQFFTLRPEQ